MSFRFFSRSLLGLCLVSSLSFGASPTTFDPSGLNIKMLGRSAQLENKVLFLYFEKVTPTLLLIDMDTNKAKQVSHPEFSFLMPYIFARKNGFTIVPASKLRFVYQLDDNGELIDTIDLHTIKDWVPKTWAYFMTPMDESVFMATLLIPKSGKLSLAMINLEEGTLDILHEQPLNSADRQYWVPLGNDLVFVNQEEGSMKLVSTRDFSVIKELRGKQEPLKRAKVRQGRHPLHPILSQPEPYKKGFTFSLMKKGLFGIDSETIILTPQGMRIRETVPIATWKGTELVYNWDKKTLNYK